MSNPSLHDLLTQLHAELEGAESVDDESRELLRHLLGDARRVLERSGESPADGVPLVGVRFGDAIQRFEVTHPTLTTLIAQISDTLNGLGV